MSIGIWLALPSITAPPADSPTTEAPDTSAGAGADLSSRESAAGRASERVEIASRSGQRPDRQRSAEKQPKPPEPDPSRCGQADAASSHQNGSIATSEMCELPQSGETLHPDAAEAWWRLNRSYRQEFGSDVCLTDSYRSLGEQETLYAAKPGLAAAPGTSNHGMAVAVDVCGGVETGYGAAHEWFDTQAGRFGWQNPSWAQPGGSRPEPWHWEYVGG